MAKRLPNPFEDEDDVGGPSFLAEFGPEALNPLIIVGEDTLEELSEKQQLFLLARMVMSTDKAAAKHADVHYDTVFEWKKRPAFQRAYEVIRNDPVNFALTVSRQIVAKAALEHMALLGHPNIRVRQWAIDLAYRNAGVQNDGKSGKVDVTVLTTFEQLRQLAKEIPVEADAPNDQQELSEPEPGQYRLLDPGHPGEEERVGQMREEPEVLPS